MATAADFLDPGRQARATNNCVENWRCSDRFPLTCARHGERIWVRCNRRSCPGCRRRLAWVIQQRFLAGIEQVPPGLQANFFTLTFPADRAPDEDAAHAAFRSLIQRLRWRGLVEAYGWTLDRTKRGVLHHHGVMTMPFMGDGLAEWRELIVASGFGVQNRLARARPEHAGYCARYIATKVPDLAKRRRTHSFSRNFPEASYVQEQHRIREVGESIGLEPECEWVPAILLT